MCKRYGLANRNLSASSKCIYDDSHCDRIHSSLTTVRCFENGYVRKQPVAWKEYCAEYWLKELHESMDWCTSRRDITEILLIKSFYTYKDLENKTNNVLKIGW